MRNCPKALETEKKDETAPKHVNLQETACKHTKIGKNMQNCVKACKITHSRAKAKKTVQKH
jgi:hypothetical protein